MKNNILIWGISGILFVMLMSYMAFNESSKKIEYPLHDAVTYFDKNGRYQLINTVAEDYFIIDARENKSLISFILNYTQQESKIYAISNPNRQEVVYAILDLENNILIQYENINSFEENDQQIFRNVKDMVDLTKERSEYLKDFLEILPLKLRKW